MKKNINQRKNQLKPALLAAIFGRQKTFIRRPNTYPINHNCLFDGFPIFKTAFLAGKTNKKHYQFKPNNQSAIFSTPVFRLLSKQSPKMALCPAGFPQKPLINSWLKPIKTDQFSQNLSSFAFLKKILYLTNQKRSNYINFSANYGI